MANLQNVSPQLDPAANFARLNAAIAEAAKVSQKADQAGLNLLASRVDTKADKSGLDLVASVVASRRVDATRSLTRPGDGPLAFTLVSSPADLAGDAASLPDLTAPVLTFGDDGRAVQLSSPAIVGMRRAVPIEPDRVYRLRAAFRRRANSADPSNDTVRVGIVWLSQAHLVIGTTVVQDFTATNVSDGRRLVLKTLARGGGEGVDHAPPPGGVYARAYVQSYGSTGLVSVEIIDIEDVTDATLLPAISTDAIARIGALESHSLPGRVASLESAVSNPLSRTFASISDAAAEHIDPAIQTVHVLGNVSAGDGRAHWFKRVEEEPDVGLTFTDQDGQIWAETDQTIDPAFRFSSDVQGTELLGIDGQSFFVYREATTPALAGRNGVESVGRFQLNAQYTGGNFGQTRKALHSYATAGANTSDFIWSFLSELDNHAGGTTENTAGYFQARKRGHGATWALVAEAMDLTAQADPARAMVAFEVDVVANGTDAHFNRMGLHIVARRPAGSTGPACVAGHGIKVDSSTDTSAVFRYAYTAVGNIERGLDLSGADITEYAISLAANQRIAVEETGVRHLSYDPDAGLLYHITDDLIVRIDNNGAAYVAAVKFESTGQRQLSYEAGVGLVYRVQDDGAPALRVNDFGDLFAGRAVIFGDSGQIRLSGTTNVGAASALLAANKPGSNQAAPAVWLEGEINGTQVWVPAWAG
ncbi:hypothetical protein [Enterovirga aerilata]|uniref:Uncharacterized protein n=1 Tax=Enterovirga aerilata TaxID=2730920 RepID=A0A849I6G3_9HYPH|nr:hypothetical protein [Enterovirga sp. DB1703]NNM75072.1 hypothetical protein [Enterovirga sp. DB1703]